MANTMVPYFKVLNEGEDQDPVFVSFIEYPKNIHVVEDYCVNPACSCTNANLYFIELSEEGDHKQSLFSIQIDLHTLKIHDKKIVKKNIGAEKLIQEFIKNFHLVKDRLLSHMERAKEYGRKNYLDFLPKQTIQLLASGDTLGYVEVFGDNEKDQLTVDFENTEKWLLDDQYCSNPTCHCKEVILTFFRVDNPKLAKHNFMIRLSLENGTYEVEQGLVDRAKIDALVKTMRNSHPTIVTIFKQRYQKMKHASKEAAQKNCEATVIRAKPSVGRNDPCVCGSGKKYKKCCGA